MFCSGISIAQEISITPKKLSYYKLYEWPGKGVIVAGKDFKGNTLQQEITLVSASGETKWQEQYMPQVENPYPIYSEHSDYLYFLDQLEPDNGKIFYNQTNLSGYIRKGSVYFPPIFRSVSDIDYSSCELIDINNATDDLIFHFRLKDKKNKQYQDVLVFLNHYSLKTFIAKVPAVFPFDVVEKGDKSLLYFAGSKADENYFVHTTVKDKKEGFDILIFDKKGAFSGSRFLLNPDTAIELSDRKAFFPSGAYYNQGIVFSARGQLFFMENEWYLSGRKGTTLSVWKQDDNDAFQLFGSYEVKTKKNPGHAVGLTKINGNLLVTVSSDLEQTGFVLSEKGETVASHEWGEQQRYSENPSGLLRENSGSTFWLLFDDGWRKAGKIEFSEELQSLTFEKE